MPTTLAMINIDGPDPRAQAAFYGELLGWRVVHAEDEYAMISGEGAPIGFGRVPGWGAPPSPDPERTKQHQPGLAVDDPDAAIDRARELGASLPDDQPGERWRVLLDPVGH